MFEDKKDQKYRNILPKTVSIINSNGKLLFSYVRCKYSKSQIANIKNLEDIGLTWILYTHLRRI
uniref:Uncharacterized protein n=1 Tax=Arundo donax TaxID=35708 RepID=A0A0A9D1K9_ARUDO